MLSALSTAALWLAGIGLVLMTAFVAWQVFCRYVLNDSPSWTEPGSVMLMSWFIFLGAAVGVRENYHLGFDVLLYVLPKGGKRWLRMISDLVALAFGIGMIWYGGQLVALTWDPPCRRSASRAAGTMSRSSPAACSSCSSRWSASCCASPARRSTTCSMNCRRRKSPPNSTQQCEGLRPWNSGSCSASSPC